jgi:hypothetical protein
LAKKARFKAPTSLLRVTAHNPSAFTAFKAAAREAIALIAAFAPFHQAEALFEKRLRGASSVNAFVGFLIS